MDWGTHVVLAAKMLKTCGLDPGAAVYSDIPVIDNTPAHYHRVYAHILENFPDFLDVAIEVFGSPEFARRDFSALRQRMETKVKEFEAHLDILPASDDKGRQLTERKIYAHRRIVEECPVFSKHLETAASLVGDPQVSRVSTDRLAAALSLVSHPYFDVWNNPVQFFLPNSAFASARWEFWTKVDYMKFRGDFYKEKNITRFRQEMVQHPLWNVSLEPEAMIKALIIRMGEMGAPAIPYETVDWGIRRFLRSLGIDKYQRAPKEIEFCHQLETEIDNLIIRDFKRPV